MADPNPGGPNLWAGLPIDDIKTLIKFSAGELARCYARKDHERELGYSFNAALEKEIQFFERAHDNHWSWLRVRTREIYPLGSEKFGASS